MTKRVYNQCGGNPEGEAESANDLVFENADCIEVTYGGSGEATEATLLNVSTGPTDVEAMGTLCSDQSSGLFVFETLDCDTILESCYHPSNHATSRPDEMGSHCAFHSSFDVVRRHSVVTDAFSETRGFGLVLEKLVVQSEEAIVTYDYV